MEDEQAGSGVSRRTLIKRTATGAAVVWAAPVLTSMVNPASAQFNYDTCTECAIGGDNCGGQPACSQGGCSCLRTVDGGCFCHQGSACSALQHCTAQSDCPSGWACSLSCCSANNTDFYCHPPCGTAAGAAAAGGARSMPG